MGKSPDQDGVSTSSRHLEIERKFDVEESTVSPSFDGLAAVVRVERSPTQTLDAVYFDTPGRDLAAHRITLRRRTGGADAGWHLKLPAGGGARTEVRMPLTDGDEVPDELRDVVLAIVRDRPLEPVARITTNRIVDHLYGGDGTALAEFADDHVTAWAQGNGDEQHWREWELELSEDGIADGQADDELLDRLTNRLHDAGAQPAGHASKLARVLDGAAAQPATTTVSDDLVRQAVAEEIENLLVWDRAVREDVDDSVHQMRVTTRKIRSLLQSSGPAFGLSDDAWILDELRQLASVLGLARDAEVLAERYQTGLDELPRELVRGPVRQRLVDGERRRYRSGLRKSLTAMRSPRYFRLLDALEALVATEPPPPEPGEERSNEATIEAAYKRVRKRAKASAMAEAEHRDEALHRIRKAAKKLRYTAAATGEQKVADAAKNIQSLLGDHQDSVVSRTHLTRQADAAHAAGEDTFTYGMLHERENELARRSREQLDAALKALDKAVRKAL
jgi:CHAD domain-containing protein